MSPANTKRLVKVKKTRIKELKSKPSQKYVGSQKKLSKCYVQITKEGFNSMPPIYQEIVRLINEEGYSWQKAALKVGYAKGMAYPIKKRILTRYALKSKKMEKKAYTVINDILDNKAKVSAIKQVKDRKTGKRVTLIHKQTPDFSHQLQAANMIFERTQPVPKGPLVTVTNNFSPVDLDKYRNKELKKYNEKEPIDITPIEV
jgi:hypothetical protein